MFIGTQFSNLYTAVDTPAEAACEYLIGSDAKIKCLPYFWPKDKCSWTVMCMEHEADGRAKGGHRFKVLLLLSDPPYKDKSRHKTSGASISALHVREAI